MSRTNKFPRVSVKRLTAGQRRGNQVFPEPPFCVALNY